MDQTMTRFTHSVIPSDEYMENLKASAEKVRKALQLKSPYEIDRVIYSGSVGKSTGILAPDMDLVVFQNSEMPPFEKVFDEWEDILIMNEGINLTKDGIKKTSISLQFTFEEGIEMDLLPATNFVHGIKPEGPLLAKKQSDAVLSKMDKSNSHFYSSSLSESQVYFMKEQTSFTHDAVRLAKFWYKSLYLGERPIYGVKTILELIAIAAAMKEEDRDKKSLLRTFAKFLDNVAQVDKLRLKFSNSNGKWELENTGGKVPFENYIIEPSNPYNNLAKQMINRDKEVNNLKEFAKISRLRISDAMKTHKVSVESVFNLFRPLPTSLYPTFFSDIGRADIIVGEDPSFRGYNPDMKIYNENIIKNPGMKELLMVNAVKIFLSCTVNAGNAALVANNKEVTLTEVRQKLRRMIDEDLKGTPHNITEWLPTTNRVEDFDIVFTVPISTNLEKGAVKIGFRWR
ncbi:uncharacterized protein LOC118436521 isoform X2 [Folsomia candida]|nr:uncharacterized protein LOC118436521 isoform X2 [Folsomia candida]